MATNLIHHPIVRDGNRLLRDPLLRPTAGAVQRASRRYRHSERAVLTQLDAAGVARLLCLDLDAARRARDARSIVATIMGHQMICDLTDTDAALWDRVSQMWEDLLPAIATDTWLEHWRAGVERRS